MQGRYLLVPSPHFLDTPISDIFIFISDELKAIQAIKIIRQGRMDFKDSSRYLKCNFYHGIYYSNGGET